MEPDIRFTDGQVDSPPIVLKYDLYCRIEKMAAKANMEAVELIQLLLKNVFDDPEMSLERLANLIREMPE